MAGSNSNYSILVDVALQEESIKKQLKQIEQNKDTKLNIKVGADGAQQTKTALDNVSSSTKKLNDETENIAVTYQQFRQVLDLATSALSNMYEQVKTLDDAITEFKKVSDLQGTSLDKYVSKLSQSGREVARTGKPNRSEPVCTDGKCA